MGTENNNSDSGQTGVDGKNKKTKGLIIGLVVLVAVVVAGYLGMAQYYGSHFFHNTVIDGVAVGNETVAQVNQQLFQDKDYDLLVYSRGIDDEKVSVVVSGNAIGLQTIYSRTADDILNSQNKYSWISGLTGKNEYVTEAKSIYDEEALKAVLDKIGFLQKENMIAPVDACVAEYSEADGQYVIAAEKQGTIIDVEKAKELITEALNNQMPEIDLTTYDIYEEPAVLSDDVALLERIEQLNTTLGCIVTYTFGDDTEVVDASVFENWFNPSVTDDKVDKGKVRSYVEGLAEKYNTYGIPQNFTTKDGYVLHLRKGNYGWEIDVDTETEQLYQDIVSGNKISREPAFTHRAASFGESDIGDTYIEVDMTNQVAYVWENGNIKLETKVVTGNYYGGHATPSGIYAVYGKAKNRVLRGPGYASFVYYWMPFNKAIGLHDATWRSAFGGTYYLYSGSHGCVNLPLKAATEIFDFVYIDLPVVTYYLQDEFIVSKPDNIDTEEAAEEDSEEESEEDESFKNKVVVDVEAISTNAASEN